MNTKSNDGCTDYIEFPATDIAKTKTFYSQVFGSKFTYGPDYTSFEDGRRRFGAPTGTRGVLGVLYADDLAATGSSRTLLNFPAAADSTLPIRAATNWLCGRKYKLKGLAFRS